jgi:hypothetical protein
MGDLPPSSPPPPSRETTPEQSPRLLRIKKSNRPPQRLRSDSLPAADDLFLPGYEYDDATVVNDREPSPPDLPPVSYVNERTAIDKSNTQEPTAASTDVDSPTSEMVAGWTALRTARLAIEKWIQPLGPVSGWAQKFREGYDNACQAGGNTQEDVDRFLGAVQEHVHIGRGILGKLGESPIIRPQPSMDAWADWLIAGDMLGTLHQGIAILEAHLDILAPRCPIPSDSTSKTRQWVGLDDLI